MTNFLWGAATSSHQVEGDNRNNDWWAWERDHPRRIRDGLGAGEAAQWWAGGAEMDLATAAALGHRAHRLSLEWSRIEPAPGRFDAKAIARYGDILHHARGLGLSLYVTLNHFTLPQWVGPAGWLEPGLPDAFARYAVRAVDEFAPLVNVWATLNEPTVLAWKAYARRDWPPARGRPADAAVALKQQLLGHAAAYHSIKARKPMVKVGLVLSLPRIDPDDPRSVFDQVAANAHRWLANGGVLHALETGWCRSPVGLWPSFHPELKETLDHLGINYYGRYLVRFSARAPLRLFGRHVQVSSVRTETSDWGQPSAGGLVRQLRQLRRFGVPLYVTENGIFDPDDSQRPQFIHDHAAAVLRARSEGIDVAGYFHWSLIDNFEWAQGWTAPFGLISLDHKTQTRKIRPSARVLERYARAAETPSALAL
jgi:beta-glucosidase